ncbi:MAG: GNAT family N-acetyltransferase [bacterium]|nr:GNAT family N-acetyltransferase [bacterium]
MNGIKIINFRKLEPNDAQALSKLMNQDTKDYSQYFVAFEFDIATIESILAKAKNDVYYGVFWGEELTGFYMLRGFDEGYSIPSYGVYISSRFSDKGLAALTLSHAISTCKFLGCKKLRLKVHTANTYALKQYVKFGFVETGFDEKINNIIMHRDI